MDAPNKVEDPVKKRLRLSIVLFIIIHLIYIHKVRVESIFISEVYAFGRLLIELYKLFKR
ncbi:hypothetical protein PKHYL_21050 [Psychrobacter sp. KH172YL61]|nr:hypothetical protein AOT82_376 [Psychrobacter sp. AntiMn-1]BBI67914.1 hypothetical protein PKHYL_21050 [Psychrobacter sp. KH172YL61]